MITQENYEYYGKNECEIDYGKRGKKRERVIEMKNNMLKKKRGDRHEKERS